MTAKIERRFLEDSFPIKEVSIESAKEKSIRKGHISTLHLWWARRPLLASRAINYSALIPTTKSDEMPSITRFITEIAKWRNSNNSNILSKARRDILSKNCNNPPKVLDPFAGGGSLPLEALRLGCETYASDYNPVALLILKCTLEFPQKILRLMKKDTLNSAPIFSAEKENQLIRNLRKWGDWVLEECAKELEKLYPKTDDESKPLGYFWARTVPCQNPSCGAEIPLMRQFWLSRKEKKNIALFPYVSNGKIQFRIVGTGYDKIPKGFHPANGTVSRAVAVCPKCKSTIDATSVRALFTEGKSGQRLIALVSVKKGGRGKKYQVANEVDENIFNEIETQLEEKRRNLTKKWGIDPVPDEPIKRVPVSFGVNNLWVYNMTKWGDLFNPRQKLALITFTEKVREAYEMMRKECIDEEYAKVLVSYLAILLDRLVDKNSTLVVYNVGRETLERKQAGLGMVWDYVEVNPFTDVGWHNMQDWVEKVIEHCSKIHIDNKATSRVFQASATSIPFPQDYFDAVLTDPPYYDNVPYSYLSDFFYVWLKRAIGFLYPELFSTPLTPKSNEIVAYSNDEGRESGKQFFEDMLKKSFIEINRVLKPNGIAVIVYAHKSSAGWETLVNSLLDSGLVITAAWPIHTEMGARLRANESAALSSSIYIVARKLEKIKIGIYKDVKEELENFLSKKMGYLWKEGVSGADFLVSAIGASIMVFGKYEQVLRENTIVRADVMLEDVRRIVTDYAVRQVLHNGFAAEISNLSRFYLLWRWSYGGAILPFDDARKLSQSTLVDLSHEWSRPSGVIRKQKENVCLLGPQDRTLEELTSIDKKDLIDVLHMALLLWQKGDREAIVELLSETGLGNKDSFYRVAQAISETLPKENQEKKLIEGFLAGKERLSSETKKINIQKRLFE